MTPSLDDALFESDAPFEAPVPGLSRVAELDPEGCSATNRAGDDRTMSDSSGELSSYAKRWLPIAERDGELTIGWPSPIEVILAVASWRSVNETRVDDVRTRLILSCLGVGMLLLITSIFTFSNTPGVAPFLLCALTILLLFVPFACTTETITLDGENFRVSWEPDLLGRSLVIPSRQIQCFRVTEQTKYRLLVGDNELPGWWRYISIEAVCEPENQILVTKWRFHENDQCSSEMQTLPKVLCETLNAHLKKVRKLRRLEK